MLFSFAYIIDFVDHSPPIDEVIQSGVVPRLVHFLSSVVDFSELQVRSMRRFIFTCIALCFH